MAGHAKTIAILGVVLVAGISAAVWLAMSDGADDAPAGPDAVRGTPAESGTKAAATAAARPKKLGTATVFGEIRRSAGKAPVVGQKVVLAPDRGEPWTVETDAQGAFRFEHVPHGGPYELSAAATGCGTIRLPGIALDRNERRNVGTLLLDPSVRLAVRVRSSGDAPVEGAVVEAFPIAQSADYDWSKALAQVGQAPISVAKTSTDATGDAVFPEMAVGDWTFTAKKAGFATGGARSVTVRSDEAPRPVTIYMWPGHPLDGRVLGPDEKPVADALVMAGAVNTAWEMDYAPLRARATTDAEGRYAFAALPSGDEQLWVGRAGRVPAPSATVRVPLVPHFDIVLKATGTLAGTVTDKESGKAVEGVTVRATSWESDDGHGAESVTDAEGRYSMEMTAGAVNELTAEKEGLTQVRVESQMGQQRQAVLHEGETAVRDIKMRRGARLSGVVKGPDGPIAGARVNVQVGSSNDGWNQKWATTGADGRYEFASLEKGLRLVLAEKEGYYLPDAPENWWNACESADEAKEFKVDIPESGEATRDLELKRGALVEGRVDGPDGAPLAGVRVYGTGTAASPPTGADGEFRLDGVTPGKEVQIFPVKEDYSPAQSAPIAVVADRPTAGVVLRMLQAGRVRGTLTTKSGGPLRDARVLLAQQPPAREDQSDNPWEERNRWQNAVQVPVRADGTFDAPMPFGPPGKLFVRAVSIDQQETDAPAMDIVEGRAAYEVNLVLDDGVDLAGKVVAAGGAGVAGAEVSIARHFDHGEDGSTYYGGGAAPVWAVADVGGAFRVPHLSPRKYDVRVQARRFVVSQTVANLAESGAVTIELSPELTIEGTVAYADGRPVEGVELQIASTGKRAEAFGGMSSAPPSAIADAKGFFRLNGVAQGRYTIEVSVPWGAQMNVRKKSVEDVVAGAKDVKIVVESGGSIAGHVLDAKRRPVTDAWISANPTPKEGSEDSDDDWHYTQPKPDGTFELLGLGAGPFMLEVESNSSSATFRPKKVKDVAVGTKDLEIVLEDGLSISGFVVDPDGKPIPQLRLTAQPEDENADSSNASTDAEGKFTVNGLAPGLYRIEVARWSRSAGGWVLDAKEAVNAGATGLRLEAKKGATISGVVVDEAGKPVEGAQIDARQPKQPGRRTARTKADGSFEVAGLALDGVYTVKASLSGRVTTSVEKVAAGAADVRLVLAKGFAAAGRLFDAAGKPMKETQIRLQLAGGGHEQYVATDGDGSFTVDGLANGTYEASVYVKKSAGEGEWKNCGSLKPPASDVELRLQP